LESFLLPINWQTEQETSNQMHYGSSQKIGKKCTVGKIFYETKCAAGKTFQTKCAAGQNS